MSTFFALILRASRTESGISSQPKARASSTIGGAISALRITSSGDPTLTVPSDAI